jgi:hypothetical protein
MTEAVMELANKKRDPAKMDLVRSFADEMAYVSNMR